MTLDPSQHGDNPLNSAPDSLEGGRDLPRPANDSSAKERGKPINVNRDEEGEGQPIGISARAPEAVINADGSIEAEYTVLENKPKKKGFFSKLYNSVAAKVPPKEILLDRKMWMDRGKDVLTGAGIAAVARYSFIGAGTLVGLSGLPLVAGSALAAGIGRTLWKIHTDKKAYNAENDEQVSYWEFAGMNKKKYLTSLATSTAFATVGSAFMTYVVPHIEPVMAPLFNKLAEIPAVSAALGFIAGKWKDVFGGSSMPQPQTLAGDTIKPPALKVPDVAAMTSAPATPPAISAEEINRRVAQAHDAVKGATQPQISGEEINRRVAEAHALASAPAKIPSLVDAPLPAPSVTDKISALAHDNHLSRRWQAIAERAVGGNAQAQKDIAKAILNGTNGFDKNPIQAAEIYRAAADAGNMQAKVDLAYMQFHGLGGIHADPKAAAAALREHAGSNTYARSMLHNLTGEGAVKHAASAAVDRAPNGDVMMTVKPSAPITVSELPAALPAATIISAPGQIPDGAKLNVTWTQNAEGVIEGVVKNAPEWLKDGMQVAVPVAQVQ